MRWMGVVAALALACGGEKDSAVDTSPPADTDTDTDADADADADTDTDTDTAPAPGAVTAASCAVQSGNALRVDCAVERSEPGAVAVTLADGRVFTSDAPSTTHTVVLWGLKPSTTYGWEASATDGAPLSGDVTTDALPGDVALSTTVTGTTPTVDAVLMPRCGTSATAVMVDGDGDIVWYQDFSEIAGSSLYSLSWSDEGTVLASLDHDTVVEMKPAGDDTTVLDLPSLGLDGKLHHDLVKRDGRFYLLYAFARDSLVIDGVYVLANDGTLLGDIDSSAWYDTSSGGGPSDPYWGSVFPGAASLAHANSVSVGADGELLVSFRFLDAVVAADGAPDSAGFGDLLWALEGGTSSLISGTVDLVSSGGATSDLAFEAPHCVSHAPSGRITVFDNGDHTTSRALVMAVDGTSADIEATYSMNADCPDQSSVFELDGGEVVATCAGEAFVAEFAPGASTSTWRLDVDCSAGGGPPGPSLTRGTPVDLTP